MRARTSDDAACAWRDEGSGTVWVAAFSAVLATVAAAGLLLADVSGARQRAEAAADLSALAGAAATARGEDGCVAAGRVAVRDGARLESCSATAGVISVDASVPLPPAVAAFGRSRLAVAARAGPERATT